MAAEALASESELSALQSLFSLPEGSLQHSEHAAYLAQLPSHPLSHLLALPTSLSSQSHTLTSSLTALTHTSYTTFLTLHQSSTALLGALASLEESLDTVLDRALPALDDAARLFREKSGPGVLEERRRARVVLDQQDKLHSLLDIPALIDACVRNGLYAEALALAAHASAALAALSLAPPHSGDEAAVEDEAREGADACAPALQLARSLHAEVTASLHSMRLLLLNTLFEPARKLPGLWKAVQFLRRMQAMSEDELALAFASARMDCLRNALQGVERDAGISATAISEAGDAFTGTTAETREQELDHHTEDIARFLKKYIDVWREGAHDIIAQYTTIFLERSQQFSAPSETPSIAPPDSVIKQTLLPTLLSLLLPAMRTHLRRAYPHLAPLATQLAYCSLAMARVGLEFRALLPPLVAQAVAQGFKTNLRIGAECEWDATLSKYTSGRSKSNPPSAWLISSVHPLPSLASLVVQPSIPAHVPPHILTNFPPLAINLNTYLRALNRLRSLVPLNAMRDVLSILEYSLSKLGRGLLSYAKEWEGGEQKELDVLRAAGVAYAHVMVPFLRRAVIEGVFGAPYGEQTAREEVRGTNSTDRSEEDNVLDAVLRSWESWLSDTI